MSAIKATQTGLVDTDEAAAALGISRRKLQELVSSREIDFIKIGRSIRFDPADIERFKDAHRVRARGWKESRKANH